MAAGLHRDQSRALLSYHPQDELFRCFPPRDRELHRRHAALLLVLGFCSFVCCSTLLGRRIYTGERDFRFLVWNLILAWVPLAAATFAHWLYLARQVPGRRVAVAGAIGVWFLFFPNAPYLVSDLKHLAEFRPEAPLWFDAILVCSFVLTGITAGLASLILIHDLARRRFGTAGGWTVVGVASVMSGFGIYLGRFVRLNSWDVLLRPFWSLRAIWEQFADGERLFRMLVPTCIYGGSILLGYLAVIALARVASSAAVAGD